MLSAKDKEWIERAVEKELTELQVKKKLKDAKYTDEKIDEFVEYYEGILPDDDYNLPSIDEEEKFKKTVRTYFEDKDKLSWGEKREVKKWLKNLDKCIKSLDYAIANVKKEFEYIKQKQDEKGILIERELEDFKKEIVDRIMDTKEIIYIEDPHTKIEATKMSLMKCSIDELIKLLEENVEILRETVDGKIAK